MAEIERDVVTAHHTRVELGSFSVLPGMSDHDFDNCTCSIGWPMGIHHDLGCPAQCICGKRGGIDGDGSRQTCGYHSGRTLRVPVGPSVMTERWDLPEAERGIQQNVQIVVHDTEGETQSRRAGEEKSRSTALA